MKYRNIDRNVRSTVTVAYRYNIYTYRENVALKSQVWGSLTLAQLIPLLPRIYTLISGTSRFLLCPRLSLFPPSCDVSYKVMPPAMLCPPSLSLCSWSLACAASPLVRSVGRLSWSGVALTSPSLHQCSRPKGASGRKDKPPQQIIYMRTKVDNKNVI